MKRERERVCERERGKRDRVRVRKGIYYYKKMAHFELA